MLSKNQGLSVVSDYKAYGINAGSIPACFTMRKHKQQQLFINQLKKRK